MGKHSDNQAPKVTSSADEIRKQKPSAEMNNNENNENESHIQLLPELGDKVRSHHDSSIRSNRTTHSSRSRSLSTSSERSSEQRSRRSSLNSSQNTDPVVHSSNGSQRPNGSSGRRNRTTGGDSRSHSLGKSERSASSRGGRQSRRSSSHSRSSAGAASGSFHVSQRRQSSLSSSSRGQRRSSSGAGAASGSFHVSQRRNISLSSTSSPSRGQVSSTTRRRTSSGAGAPSGPFHVSQRRNISLSSASSPPRGQVSSTRGRASSSAGAACGSFHVSQRRNISLSSHSPTRRSNSGHRRRQTTGRSRSSSQGSEPNIAVTRDDSMPDLATISSGASPANLQDLIIPGAFHTDSHDDGISVLSGSTHHRHDGDSTTGGSSANNNENEASSRSALRSVSENHREQPVVEATTVAQDYEDELEQAREQGRREALNRFTSRPETDDIAVAVATGSADGDDDDFSKDDDEATDEKRKKTILCYVALLCCIIIAIGTVGTLLLFGGGNSDPIPLVFDDEDLESNLKGVIVYTPPTQEECEDIANGMVREDQQKLIQKSFDIQIDITLEAEADFGPLLSDLIRHIQEKLLPLMAGCGAINFFDATMAIAGDLTNTTEAITNGQVKPSKEKSCANRPIENCKSYVLILDLYLEEDRSNAVLLEAIGSTVTSEEITKTMGSIYPVQTASVPMIEPAMDDDTPATTTPTEDPSKEAETSPPLPTPTAVPATDAPVIDVETTTAPAPEPTFPDDFNTTSPPTKAPTTSPTTEATPSPVPIPGNNPTVAATMSPTKEPTRSPTTSPTKNPSKLPTVPPTPPPTTAPTPPPTMAPTPPPTVAPTPPPTEAPTPPPTKAPTKAPTEAPTEPTTGTFCCSRNFLNCGGVDDECQESQASCEACASVWIEEGSCTELGRNDDCTDNESGCCAGICTPQGNGRSQCRL
ncbi:unnamed protein product [Cylindrotheca closterium]|uniref:SEA domain-containing protein n=1 Tax=Cylindrotheca closterium TaxID=2856 RepID=A0AAD2FZN3_9STRA|nr:unnamed protein product [Cylindrotheca closterium]